MSGLFNTTKPVFMFVARDEFMLCQNLRFTRENGDIVSAPILWRQQNVAPFRTVRMGFVTDFASKPWLAEFLVGSRCDEGVPAYVLHDFLYCAQTLMRAGQPFHVSRGEADVILAEMLRALHVPMMKVNLIYSGVCMGGGAHWKARPENYLDTITPETPGDDYAILPVAVQPSFDTHNTNAATQPIEVPES